jgi:hypothetical protein
MSTDFCNYPPVLSIIPSFYRKNNHFKKVYFFTEGMVEEMYLDPGFGGMLIQVVVALVAVGGAIVFSARKKISALFSKKKKGAPAKEAARGDDNVKDDAVDMLSDEE